MIQPLMVSLAPVSRGTGLRGSGALCTLALAANPPSTEDFYPTLKLFGLGSWVGQGGWSGGLNLCFRTHFLIKIQENSDGEARVLEAFFVTQQIPNISVQ